MPFQKIASEKLAAAVVRQIEQLVLHGILRPGDRLPAERELSERLGVSRPSLREAIATSPRAACSAPAPGPASSWPTFWATPSRPR